MGYFLAGYCQIRGRVGYWLPKNGDSIFVSWKCWAICSVYKAEIRVSVWTSRAGRAKFLAGSCQVVKIKQKLGSLKASGPHLLQFGWGTTRCLNVSWVVRLGLTTHNCTQFFKKSRKVTCCFITEYIWQCSERERSYGRWIRACWSISVL